MRRMIAAMKMFYLALLITVPLGLTANQFSLTVSPDVVCYGPGCPLPCHCRNDVPCDRVTGACPNGCAEGKPANYSWQGTNCQIGNVAYNKPAIQSTVYYDGQPRHAIMMIRSLANWAVDGELSNFYAARTGFAPRQYWSVDLGGQYVVQKIVVYLCGAEYSNFPERINFGLNMEYNDVLHKNTFIEEFINDVQFHVASRDYGRVSYRRANSVQVAAMENQDDPSILSRLCLSEVVVIGYKFIECPDGFYFDSPGCQEQCRNTFGPNCSNPCPCRDVMEQCHPVTGMCARSGCLKGWTGRHCEIRELDTWPNRDFIYERNYHSKPGCHCHDNSSCLRIGLCPRRPGCDETTLTDHPWHGPFCQLGNLALGRITIQSAYSQEFPKRQVSSRWAVDGSPSPENFAHVISPKNMRYAWWSVDLGMQSVITSVRIYNKHLNGNDNVDNFCRYDCHCDDVNQCSPLRGSCGPNKECSQDSKEFMNKWHGANCEIGNLAVKKEATQDGDFEEYFASRAVDGIISRRHNYSNTDARNTPWWMVDLNMTAVVQVVDVYNIDHPISDRLSHFQVLVGNSSDINTHRVVGLWNRTAPNGQKISFYMIDYHMTLARYVSIRLLPTSNRIATFPYETYLHLLEVAVYGYRYCSHEHAISYRVDVSNISNPQVRFRNPSGVGASLDGNFEFCGATDPLIPLPDYNDITCRYPVHGRHVSISTPAEANHLSSYHVAAMSFVEVVVNGYHYRECPHGYKQELGCSTPCDDFTYGLGCAFKCHCLNDVPCNKETGECSARSLCKEGKYGRFCDEDVPFPFSCANESKECPIYVREGNGSSCAVSPAGWKGPDCQIGNVAFDKTAWESNAADVHSKAHFAIDGNPATKSITILDRYQDMWWRVDLKRIHVILSISISYDFTFAEPSIFRIYMSNASIMREKDFHSFGYFHPPAANTARNPPIFFAYSLVNIARFVGIGVTKVTAATDKLSLWEVDIQGYIYLHSDIELSYMSTAAPIQINS